MIQDRERLPHLPYFRDTGMGFAYSFFFLLCYAIGYLCLQEKYIGSICIVFAVHSLCLFFCSFSYLNCFLQLILCLFGVHFLWTVCFMHFSLFFYFFGYCLSLCLVRQEIYPEA